MARKQREGFVMMLFEVPKEVKTMFKMACSKQDKTMSAIITRLMVSFAYENGITERGVSDDFIDEL